MGGSYLGPFMAYEALKYYSDRGLTVRLASNIDGNEFAEATCDLDPAETLFIVSSKTFTTLETLTNARSAREWCVRALGNEQAAARHFVVVSTNAGEVAKFGIATANMFEFWDWVGGRYSYDSAIGLSLLIAIGPEALSRDACRIPCNGRAAPFERNLPVLPGLIGIWYNNFFGAETAAILPYDHYPGHLSAYFMALAIQHHLTLSDMLSTIHAYPTMNTGIQQAVFEAYLEGAAAASNRRLVRTVLSLRG